MKSLLLISGSSELGKSIGIKFSQFKNHWKTLNIDCGQNSHVNKNIQIDWTKPIENQLNSIHNQISSFSQHYNCIISAAQIFSPMKFKDQKLFEEMQKLNQNAILPSLLAAHLSTKFLSKNGLLFLHGSYQILKDQYHESPIYGTAMNMVHGVGDFMANNLKELPENSKVITIVTDFSIKGENPRKPEKVLTPSAVAEQIFMWANAEAGVPANGSFVGLTGNKGIAIPEIL